MNLRRGCRGCYGPLVARWIDDLAVEQVDTDGDGSLETTLYPITDLLGSVQLLTDDAGTPVERITYDPDGTPHFWSADTNRPTVTRIAWTGDGTLPTGDTVTPQAFEIGLSEPIDPARVTNATATLTPDGGDPQSLTLTLAADGRAAYLTGATVTAGTTYTLHVDGLTDTSHNPIWPEDKQLTVTDLNAYEVLDDTTAPTLLAVLDGSDAIYLLFDEPVQPAAGYDLGTAVSMVRQGQPVDGAATRVTGQLLKWTPSDPSTYPLGGSYTISALHLADLNANTITSTPTTFTHLNTTTGMLLLAYQTPTDTHPEAQSAYGLTTLFQGRTWHADLGMYSYRARWYLPEMGEFGERDPVQHVQGSDLYAFLGASPVNRVDPLGKNWAWEAGEGWREGAAESVEHSLNVFGRMHAESWLATQAWFSQDKAYKRRVAPIRSDWDIEDSSEAAYLVGGNQWTVDALTSLTNNWIRYPDIRKPLGWANAQVGGRGLPLLLGNFYRQPASKMERTENQGIQRARVAQIGVMAEFLRATAPLARNVKRRQGLSPQFQWGDPFVSRAAVLGSRFVAGRINAFQLGSKKLPVLNNLLQSMVVNGGWSGDAATVVARFAEQLEELTDVRVRVLGAARGHWTIERSLSGNIEGLRYNENQTESVGGGSYAPVDVQLEMNGQAFTIRYYDPLP